MEGTERQEQYSNRFNSEGHAWQWLVDNTKLLPQQVIDFARGTGLSEFGVIDTARVLYDKGHREPEIIKVLQADVQKSRQEQEQDYLQNAAGYHLQEFVDGISESVNTPVISTGFEQLDQELDGGLYEGLYILGAITSIGKTTFILQISDSLAKQNKHVLYFSLEMARGELMAKSISRTTAELVAESDQYGGAKHAKTARGIMDGKRYLKYNDTEKELIKAAIQQYAGYADNLFFLEGLGDIGIREIKEAIERHKRITQNTPVVIIDYLQILAPYDSRATDKANIDKAVVELKRISRDYKTPVIAISSFNRANYNAKADLAAYKESGGIEYSSDVLIALQFKSAGKDGFDSTEEKGKPEREIELVILKNRNGRTGAKVDYSYYPAFNRFRECENDKD